MGTITTYTAPVLSGLVGDIGKRGYTPTAKDYNADSAFIFLDGIENTGFGTGSRTATTWKSLSGSNDFTIVDGIEWGDKYLKVRNTSAWTDNEFIGPMTIEVVMKYVDGRAMFQVNHNGKDDRGVYVENREGQPQGVYFAGVGRETPVIGADLSKPFYMAAVFDDRASYSVPSAHYLNGAEVTSTDVKSGSWGSWKCCIGGVIMRSGSAGAYTYYPNTEYANAGYCDLYALRVHWGRVRPHELAINCMLDSARFDLPLIGG